MFKEKKIKNLCLLNNHHHLIDTDENRVANKFFALHFLQVCRALVSVVMVGETLTPHPPHPHRNLGIGAGVRKEEIKINRKSITYLIDTDENRFANKFFTLHFLQVFLLISGLV